MLKSSLLLFACCAVPAYAQKHDHSGEVGQFYERWMRPENRLMSCCNQQDCAAVEHVSRAAGQWMMQRAKDGVWLTVPREKIENYRDDARDSPDGRSHLCSKGDLVFCAVLGDGM